MAYMRQRGIGEYDKTSDWSWEFYPPPYDFLAPGDSGPMPAPIIYTPLPRAGSTGLGGCGCGGSCGGCHPAAGLGLFESGLDVTQWGAGEWVTASVIGYLTLKMLGDLGRAGRAVKKTVRQRSYKSQKKQQLQRELAEL